MNKRFFWSRKTLYSLASAALIFAFSLQGFAQTAADTNIKNTASATYSDGNGNNFDTVSNEVTVTVAKVAGLTITPDGQTNSSVVAGQTGITMNFTVTNTGNFSNDVRFLASGASLRAVTSGTAAPTITAATAGGTDILTNAANVDKTLAQNGTLSVVVTLSIPAGASPGDVITVYLGDAATNSPTFDNIVATNSANEVKTVSTAAVNGQREARGDISVTVENNALPRVNLTAPAGPVALGSNISYSAQACNTGQRTLSPVSPASQIYVYAPIPAGTVLTNVSSLPSGTQFTTSPLSTAPLAATWTSTAPGTLSTVTRIRIPVGASIAAGACASSVAFDVTITTNNANTPIYEIVDLIGSNTLGTTVTDQSGDAISNKGDLNANFDEPLSPSGTATVNQGFQLPTLLLKTGSVFIGPSSAPQAIGPTDTNDDFTNKSVTTGIATVAPGGTTTASGIVVFTNTVQNTGNADDTYTLTAPTVPAGFTVEISTNGGTSYTTVSGGGNTTLAIPFGNSANILVRVTAPSGKTVLTGYNTVIRATSGIDNTKVNNTIDRLYTGFIKLEKTADVANGTGVGGATDAVPGAVITYTVKYTNVSEAGTASGSVGLTANNLVITENGAAGTNNWATYTTRVAGQEFDYTGASGTTAGTGTVAFNSGTGVYTDTIATLAPGAVGRFVFKRTIN
jgi:hypothetical protein